MTKKTKTEKYYQAAAVAKHFGFSIHKNLEVSKEAIQITKDTKKNTKYFDSYLPPIEEITQILLNYKEFEKENGSVPLFQYFDQLAKGPHTKIRKRNGEEQVNLNIIGVDNSIAEAILIKTIATILNENGQKNYTLHINNIGGKEAKTQFNRESTNFFRKNINLLNANCRQYFKQGIHTLITEGGDQCKPLKEQAPEPMDFLTEETRQIFTNLIERIETFQIPYEINSDILGDLNYSDHTTFYFIDNKTNKMLAAGTRLDLYSKKIGFRKSVPAITANVWITKPKTATQTLINKIGDTKNYILQISPQAKTFALGIIGLLWDNKIFVKHDLTKDRLGPQIQLSKKYKADNIIIIGYKETLDLNVMIRDAEGKSQKILEPRELIDFLK